MHSRDARAQRLARGFEGDLELKTLGALKVTPDASVPAAGGNLARDRQDEADVIDGRDGRSRGEGGSPEVVPVAGDDGRARASTVVRHGGGRDRLGRRGRSGAQAIAMLAVRSAALYAVANRRSAENPAICALPRSLDNGTDFIELSLRRPMPLNVVPIRSSTSR
jgi:hypothetical protein